MAIGLQDNILESSGPIPCNFIVDLDARRAGRKLFQNYRADVAIFRVCIVHLQDCRASVRFYWAVLMRLQIYRAGGPI